MSRIKDERGKTIEVVEHSQVKPGTRAFGQRAAARKERIQQRASRGDVRVQTAAKRAAKHRADVEKVLKEN